MSVIHRWILPQDQDLIRVKIPEGCAQAEAVEFTGQGPVLRDLLQIPPGPDGRTEFPLVQIWDDPSRSPFLAQEGDTWREQDTTQILKVWERERLLQFYKHMLAHYKAMQVIYYNPPTASDVHFHKEVETEHHIERQFFQGWRIDMVAAIFGGFDPEGFEPFSFRKRPSPVLTPDTSLVFPEPKFKLVR